MGLPERHPHERASGGAPDDGAGAAGGHLDSLRLAGQAFLTVAADAIRNALSADSEAFLQANRQRGGQ